MVSLVSGHFLDAMIIAIKTLRNSYKKTLTAITVKIVIPGSRAIELAKDDTATAEMIATSMVIFMV